MKEKKVIVECECGCSILKFVKDEDGYIYIENYSSLFYERQESAFLILKKKLKFIWFILIGKEFSLYDLVITGKEDIDNFKKQMNEFLLD